MKTLKIIFHVYLRLKWINLRQTKTKMITGSFCTHHQIHFISVNVSFL